MKKYRTYWLLVLLLACVVSSTPYPPPEIIKIEPYPDPETPLPQPTPTSNATPTPVVIELTQTPISHAAIRETPLSNGVIEFTARSEMGLTVFFAVLILCLIVIVFLEIKLRHEKQ